MKVSLVQRVNTGSLLRRGLNVLCPCVSQNRRVNAVRESSRSGGRISSDP